jgi:Ca2+/Na+ antiporter
MFAVAQTHFETVVIAALVLIYFTVIQRTAVISRLQVGLVLALSASFVHVLKRLNDPRAKEEAEGLKETTDQQNATNVRYYINAGFASVVCLIVILKLISTVLSG